MGQLHLVQMAVEPAGSENIIQGFDKYQGFEKMETSSDTWAQFSFGPNAILSIFLWM